MDHFCFVWTILRRGSTKNYRRVGVGPFTLEAPRFFGFVCPPNPAMRGHWSPLVVVGIFVFVAATGAVRGGRPRIDRKSTGRPHGNLLFNSMGGQRPDNRLPAPVPFLQLQGRTQPLHEQDQHQPPPFSLRTESTTPAPATPPTCIHGCGSPTSAFSSLSAQMPSESRTKRILFFPLCNYDQWKHTSTFCPTFLLFNGEKGSCLSLALSSTHSPFTNSGMTAIMFYVTLLWCA